jgi:N-carbamoylputrescine amidase
MSKECKLGLIQMTCSRDPAENYDKAIAYVREAASQGSNVVCLQELFKTRYFCQMVDHRLFELAEPVDETSTTVQHLAELAAELGIVLVASFFEKRSSGLYHNTAVVLNADGRYLGKYRKMHIPDDPGYYEKFYFAPGDLGTRVFDTHFGKLGVLICWDQWFPEAARLLALGGAEIILIPTAIGYHRSESGPVTDESYADAWQIVQRGHAVANACFLAAVNRVGFEAGLGQGDGIDFWGQSFVTDPYGQVVAQAAADREEVLVCSVDLGTLKEIRDGWSFPFRDRRVESYGGLTRLLLDSPG